MVRLQRTWGIGLLFVGLAAIGGCGGGSGGKLAVDSPAMPFEAPDEDDLVGDGSLDDEDDADEASDSAAEAPPAKGASGSGG
jgi:hypothetical protein